jgi:hypothetical protein
MDLGVLPDMGPRQYSSIQPVVWQVFGVASLGALPGPLFWSQTVQQYSTWECSQTSHTKHLSDQRLNTAVLSGTNIMDLGLLLYWPHQRLNTAVLSGTNIMDLGVLPDWTHQRLNTAVQQYSTFGLTSMLYFLLSLIVCKLVLVTNMAEIMHNGVWAHPNLSSAFTYSKPFAPLGSIGH